jgi:hypothetical protein
MDTLAAMRKAEAESLRWEISCISIVKSLSEPAGTCGV